MEWTDNNKRVLRTKAVTILEPYLNLRCNKELVRLLVNELRQFLITENAHNVEIIPPTEEEIKRGELNFDFVFPPIHIFPTREERFNEKCVEMVKEVLRK